MLIVMKPDATPAQLETVCARIRELGLIPHRIRGETWTINVFGVGRTAPVERLAALPGVSACEKNGEPPTLVRRQQRPDGTTLTVRGEPIGGGRFTLIAGPCAVESRDQVMRTAESVSREGVRFFRAGAYKPRTSPYAFQGLGDEGLRLLDEVKTRFDLRIVTEVKDVETLPAVAQVADVLQLGARNMHNYSLIEAVGQVGKPVLLKRGISATLNEWLLAAEYLLAGGNDQVVLCERGIRTFETMTRNTLDLAGAALARLLTQLPVLADPSHSTGRRDLVGAMSVAAVGAGLDGLLIEVHAEPSHSEKDGAQTFSLEEFETLIRPLKAVAEGVGRSLDSLHPTSAAATS